LKPNYQFLFLVLFVGLELNKFGSIRFNIKHLFKSSSQRREVNRETNSSLLLTLTNFLAVLRAPFLNLSNFLKVQTYPSNSYELLGNSIPSEGLKQNL